MGIDITVKIGGEAGQGIQTVGNLLAEVCHNAGLYLFAINDFESRIRGGHSFLQMRIRDTPVRASSERVDLLVALNRETYELHQAEVNDQGIILMDAEAAEEGDNAVLIPFGELSEKAGDKITSNTVAAGACLSLLGAPVALLADVLEEQFGRKKGDVLAHNQKAAELGYEAVEQLSFKGAFEWKKEKPRELLLDGSKAIALGALAGDCRMAAFYPMSPATSIMANLSAFSEKFPLVVEQAEDEISALNMVIGGSLAGVRAITATSGGGFSLMTEALGLAGITETPAVIVNAQRPGPATGLPTRTAQGDLLFVIRAAQDEFPRFVFAPATPAQAFEVTARALHLAEKYQVPAIILSDQFLNDMLCIEDTPFKVADTIERFIVGDADLDDPGAYKRFRITDSGVSPRAIPCQGRALVVVSGNEHREDGHISEEKSDRIAMVNKRNAKIPHMLKEMRPPQTSSEPADVLLVCWGSTAGAVKESVEMLRADGVSAGWVHFCDLWPFPAQAAEAALGNGKRFFMVEQNSTAQLGQLIRAEIGLAHAGTVLKYNGRPFFPAEITAEIKKQVG